MHDGSCDPKSVRLCDNEKIKVGIFVRKIFGQRTRNRNPPDVRKPEKKSPYPAGNDQLDLRPGVSFYSSFGQKRIVYERIKFTELEYILVNYQLLQCFLQFFFPYRLIKKELYF